MPVLAQTNPISPQTPELAFAAQARQTYTQARSHQDQKPVNNETLWQFGRACFDLAEYATNNTERALLAEQGIVACRQVLARDTNSTAAHYYLGKNLGQLARTKSLGALKLVNEMEREFLKALALDELYDRAGPDRILGLLYRDAPAIGSIGSRTKARQHLLRAQELAPNFPENQLNLVESSLAWGERANAREQLEVLEKMLPRARTNFIGSAWAESWFDWDNRLKIAQKKLADTKKVVAPRQRE